MTASKLTQTETETALVSGAPSGEAITRQLAQARYNLGLVARNETRLKKLALEFSRSRRQQAFSLVR